MKTLDRNWLATIFPDPEELEDVIAQGLAEICEQLQDLRLAIEANDVLSAREIAHRIKGIAASIGANYITANAGLIEETAAAGGPPLAPLFSSLNDAVDALCDA